MVLAMTFIIYKIIINYLNYNNKLSIIKINIINY